MHYSLRNSTTSQIQQTMAVLAILSISTFSGFIVGITLASSNSGVENRLILE